MTPPPRPLQVGQHVEFEAEWETGINIQLKLAPVVALALEWCSRDRETAIKALRKALRALEAAQGRMTAVGRELADHSASCVDYDVAASPVSIHLPLSRFVAGLLLCLDRFGLGYDSHEFQFRGKPTPEQLMELPLRTQVLLASFSLLIYCLYGLGIGLGACLDLLVAFIGFAHYWLGSLARLGLLSCQRLIGSAH